MDIDTFIEKFADQFDEIPASLTPETRFRDIAGWCSIVALSVIAMVDEEYGVTLTGDDIRKAQTIKDVFDAVAARKG